MATSGVVAAAVDIGTNSVKMTVARREADGRLSVLAERSEVTRLGKNVDAARRLEAAAVDRTLKALEAFASDVRARGTAVRIAAVGTSALRDAANGAEFVERARAILGGDVEVITGDREAELTYAAARRDPDLPLPTDPNALLATMDLGGGSTEVVIGRGGALAYRESLQLGAVRLTEQALLSDPPTSAEQANAARIVDALLAERVPILTGEGDGPPVVVASGGTAANLAGMEWFARHPEDRDDLATPDVHGTRLTTGQIEARIAALASVPLATRRTVPGLEPNRADVIVGGAIILARVLHHLGAAEVIVSLHGLRYGLLYELLDAIHIDGSNM
jgi:exopolyphosphatase/guanosine-5'-triphosphate,3'-diphosphate pyrophosphatase